MTRILATNLSFSGLHFSTGFCLILPSLSTISSSSCQCSWPIIGLDKCPVGHTLQQSWIQSTFVNIDNDTLVSQH
ncbi:hypothetical protein BDW22DRAFT_1351441 [Trametopsis cervina]|nr:hypothetical protein BDW22DRAFT_1351441 [Trametopsis cervina]